MDEHIRMAAFKWLEEQTSVFGDVFPRELLIKGFYLNEQRITLVGPQGIWKPKALESIPLSITTTVNSPYSDSFSGEYIRYSYMGTDPYHPVNKGLRKALEYQVPLIYFFGIVKGKYLAVWPVFIVGDNPSSLYFTVAADDLKTLKNKIHMSAEENPENERRRYITSAVRTRMHQRSFRERVLQAYKEQCALCRLRHLQLLDAAHIIADTEETGQPLVINGLSLCKIHHAAFDSDIIGITPDYQIKVREDVLHETDGPMLKYGIQGLQDQKLLLPRDKNKWPDRERLDVRYNRFKGTG